MLAIERGDDYWESEILAALHRLERSPFPGSLSDDAASDEWERRHTHFHHSLLAACGSPWLLHFCTVLCDQFQRYRRAVLIEISGSEGLNERVRHQHRKIADAAIARDADQAAAILSKHFQGSVDIVIERYTRLTPTRERKTANKRAETATII